NRVPLDANQGDRVRPGNRHLAHPPDVLDLVAASLVPDQADHIDAHFVEQHPVGHQPPRGEPPEPGLLVPGYRLERGTEPGARPGLDPADPHRRPSAGPDAELAFRAPPVSVEHAEPGALQVLRRHLLALTA